MNTQPLPPVTSAVGPPPADIVSTGLPIAALDRLRLMSHEEWEYFVLEWADSLKTKYQVVERCGGAGDMGRDVVAFAATGQTDPWDNYQCKHYDHPLQPSDIWIELGKLCYYTLKGEFTFPRVYYFVAPQGIGNSLSKLMRAPARFKNELLNIWDEKCKSKITSVNDVPLDAELRGHIDLLDFSRIKWLPPLTIIEGHRKTPWHVARFGGGLPVRPPVQPTPLELAAHESNYIRALLDAYEDKLHCQFSVVSELSDAQLVEHFRRSRREFYSAEALREFLKDNVPEGTFDGLLDEVHDGVIDVVDATHPDAVERVLATVKQAKTLPMTANALVSRVTSSDKGGMCHQLANNKKIKWRP